MTDAKQLLFKCFYSLDENFFKDFRNKINKRIIFQKYGLFFSVIFGLRFGDYSLYIHGPYNTTMADIGYEFANDDIQKYEFFAQTKEFTESAENIISVLKENLSINNVEFLEVFSTFFYLLNCQKENQQTALSKTKRIKEDIIVQNNIDMRNLVSIYDNIRENINQLSGSPILA